MDSRKARDKAHDLCDFGWRAQGTPPGDRRRAGDCGVTIGVQNHHDIACGFESLRRFNAVFAEQVRLKPTELRRAGTLKAGKDIQGRYIVRRDNWRI